MNPSGKPWSAGYGRRARASLELIKKTLLIWSCAGVREERNDRRMLARRFKARGRLGGAEPAPKPRDRS